MVSDDDFSFLTGDKKAQVGGSPWEVTSYVAALQMPELWWRRRGCSYWPPQASTEAASLAAQV